MQDTRKDLDGSISRGVLPIFPSNTHAHFGAYHASSDLGAYHVSSDFGAYHASSDHVSSEFGAYALASFSARAS
eukprot:CAMPEP_0172534568 /NCGR_PEP_ID=MMETSP1067-20121228/6884_1 /TAXON_ID=265564 ORGANISM="Thalassiosira punctigera, Strain Tpunct2005C2" /NCGR_SAMPLE_ID=MMETSP1067 /ASSEMBLY_ACC=CAM_ASM_000444 /LENGTH=73 /DNA_ID=CAMNT_0013319375 /DNA_START=83 /DNA_END=301 /DNA_ORIENTATION=+